jgi:hypothetical protein
MRKHLFNYGITLVIFLWASYPAVAQPGTTTVTNRGQVRVEVAQDWFVDWWKGRNFDRNYTQGTAFSLTKDSLHESPLFFPLNRLLGWCEEKFNSNEDTWEENPGRIGIGVTAFTPRVIDSKTPVIGDRPFANIVYLTTERTYFLKEKKKSIRMSFNYGLLGTNVANAFQSYAHANIVKGRPTDISWQQQISNGGRFSFLFSRQTTRQVVNILLKRKDQLSPNIQDSSSVLRFGATLGTQLEMGWYNTVGTNLTVRFGKYAPRQAFDGSILDGGNKFFPWNTQNMKVWSLYAFGTVAPRLTPYNALILGQIGRNDEYALPDKDYNPFILDVRYGLAFSLAYLRHSQNGRATLSRFDIMLAINHRSSEIRNTTYKRWHHWGELAVAFPFN